MSETFEPSGPEVVPAHQLAHKAVVTHPLQVADIMTVLAWSVRDPDELLEFLQRCVDLAVRIIGGADSAGVTVQVDGKPCTAVHTDARTLVVDARQYAAGDGPCLHAMRTGQVVLVDVASSRERWPQFTADADAAGIRSFLAAPLGTAEVGVGALNLYGAASEGFTPDDAVLLQLLVQHATRAVEDYVRLQVAENLAAQLREALHGRAPIEQAKGILMAVHGIDAAAAFERLRAQSQNTNTKLHDVAAAFVAALATTGHLP